MIYLACAMFELNDLVIETFFLTIFGINETIGQLNWINSIVKHDKTAVSTIYIGNDWQSTLAIKCGSAVALNSFNVRKAE